MIKKISLFFIILVSCLSVTAQNWGGGIDNEDYNWGFSFQYIATEFKLIKNKNWINPYTDPVTNKLITDSLLSVSSPLTQGFGVSLVFSRFITKNLDIKFTPGFAFVDRVVDYQYKTPTVNNKAFSYKQQKIAGSFFEAPIGLKLKSNRVENFRAYIVLGGKYSIDMASAKKAADLDAAQIDKRFKNSRKYFSYEGGIGFDFYFEYFKMSPEIKVSYSVKDILIHDNSPYSTPIDRAILRNFTISLFFE